MQHKLDVDSIAIVHEFLGTEKKIRFNFKYNIKPTIDESTRYVYIINDKPCIYCYVDAIEKNIKYGKCVVCSYYRQNLRYIPLSWNTFTKMITIRQWKIFANCGYDVFKLVIGNKQSYIDHKMSDISKEIIYGPYRHLYTKEKYNNIRKLLKL